MIYKLFIITVELCITTACVSLACLICGFFGLWGSVFLCSLIAFLWLMFTALVCLGWEDAK